MFYISKRHFVTVAKPSAGKGDIYVILLFTDEIIIFLEINGYQEPAKTN